MSVTVIMTHVRILCNGSYANVECWNRLEELAEMFPNIFRREKLVEKSYRETTLQLELFVSRTSYKT